MNLRYVRRIYEPDKNFDVHTDINYPDVSSLPYNAPIGYKAYVISEKVLAVFNGEVWINSKSGHNILFKTKGTTAQRPTLSPNESGFVYYDTTVEKPIWWTGVKWVSSDGTDI